MHLLCPHCRNAVEIADVPSGGEITCTSCGSSFQVAGLSTVTWDGPTKKRIGTFEILSTIGHGAFGTVLKACDTELDRVVAIKVPRPGNVGSPLQFSSGVLNACRHLGILHSPGCIPLYNANGAQRPTGLPVSACQS
jgi:serine/threonine protein kinase